MEIRNFALESNNEKLQLYNFIQLPFMDYGLEEERANDLGAFTIPLTSIN